MLARPAELFNLSRMLRPDIFSNFTTYANRYCNPKEGPYGMDYSGASNTKELHYILENKLMIRRLKKDVLKELPPKIRQRIFVKTNDGLVRQIKAILNRDFSNEQDRKSLEEMISRHSKKFVKASEVDSEQMASSEEQHSYVPSYDAEDKQISKAFKLSGEAKLKGVT